MHRTTLNGERGAILIQVGVGIVLLIAFTGLVVDSGIQWVSRHSAQNSADAGALAGAVALAFDSNDRSDAGPAKMAAHQFALTNGVWGVSPDVKIDSDITFPLCPDGTDTCVRVEVHRNQARGNPLPVWFGIFFGIADQGVRATATAQAAVANASDCLKPFAIPDKWLDVHDEDPVIDVETWTLDDAFEKHYPKGKAKGEPLPDPDVYIRPTSSGTGTGFTLSADLGTKATLKAGGPADAIRPGFFFPVRLPMAPSGTLSTGADDYRTLIATCNGWPISIGDVLQSEPGDMVGPTFMGMEDLIDLDPYATFNEGTKMVENSCAQDSPPCGPRSPRIVAIPIFDTQEYYDSIDKTPGTFTLKIVNILGFFVDDVVKGPGGANVEGYLMTIPGLKTGSSTLTPDSSFLKTILLVR